MGIEKTTCKTKASSVQQLRQTNHVYPTRFEVMIRFHHVCRTMNRKTPKFIRRQVTRSWKTETCLVS